MISPAELLDRYRDHLRTVPEVVALIGAPEDIVSDHLQMPISRSWGDVVAELATYDGARMVIRHDTTQPVTGEDGVWFRHNFKLTWKADGSRYIDVLNALIGAVLPSTGERLILKQLHDYTGAIGTMRFRTVPIRVGESTLKEVGQVEFSIDDRQF